MGWFSSSKKSKRSSPDPAGPTSSRTWIIAAAGDPSTSYPTVPPSRTLLPDPVSVLPSKRALDRPSSSHYREWARATDPKQYLGRPTAAPTKSVGLPATEINTSVTTPTPQPPAPNGPPVFAPTYTFLPPWAYLQPPVAPAPPPIVNQVVAPAQATLSPVKPTATFDWPAITYDVKSNGDNRWAGLDYILPKETRDGLGGEFRYEGQRKISNTLRRALHEP